MLKVTLNKADAIAILEPDGALSSEDFLQAAHVIDPFLEKEHKLKGIIIYAKSSPKWDSFAALITHLRFIKDHHKEVTRLAFVTDSVIGELGEKIGNHFVAAEVKHFAYDEYDNARQWILTNPAIS